MTDKPGPELDARIAEEVMGWKLFAYNQPWPCGKPHTAWIASGGRIINQCDWEPSTDIAAAWEVVKKLRDMWTEATKESSGFDDFPKPFDDTAFFNYLRRSADRRWPWALLYASPETICLAALAAVHQEAE